MLKSEKYGNLTMYVVRPLGKDKEEAQIWQGDLLEVSLGEEVYQMLAELNDNDLMALRAKCIKQAIETDNIRIVKAQLNEKVHDAYP